MSDQLQAYLSSHPSFEDPSSSTSPLPSLYSDLSRQRRSNPAGFRANIEWWKNILFQVAWDGVQSASLATAGKSERESNAKEDKGKSKAAQERLVLHLNETVKAAWTVDSVGRPLGLGTVVAELQKTSDVVSLQTFLRSTRPLQGSSQGSGFRSYVPSAGTVASTLVGRPLSWAFSQLGLGGSSGDDDESEDEKLWKTHKGDWVIWANLEKVTSAFLEDHYASASLSPLDALFSTAAFRKRLAALELNVSTVGVPFQLSDVDVEVLTKHLVRDRRVAVTDKGIIKLATREYEPASAITEQDIGILHIAETNAKLEAQIAEIEKKIEDRNAKAKAALQANQKNQALSYLRSRKMLEELLTKRMGSLETISGVLIKVEQAAGDVELLQAYETSTSTLKSLLAHPSLQHGRVEDTMTALSDTLADHAEIDQAIQLGGESARAAAGVEEIDDSELAREMELLALEREREEKEAEERRQKEQEDAEKRRVEEERRREKEELAERRRREERERFEEERRKREEQKARMQVSGQAQDSQPVEQVEKQAIAEE